LLISIRLTNVNVSDGDGQIKLYGLLRALGLAVVGAGVVLGLIAMAGK
jgi:hypothetical protein